MAVSSMPSPAFPSGGVRFSMSARACSVRPSDGRRGTSSASMTEAFFSKLARWTSKLFMTKPNSLVLFFEDESEPAELVSRVLVLCGRVEMSMGVRIMGFTLQRVDKGWVVFSGHRQFFADEHLLIRHSNLRTSFVVLMSKV